MSATRIQGLVFSCAALAVTGAAITMRRVDPQLELIVVAALVVVLGVPHGALDTIFARQLYAIHGLTGWLRFAVIYVLLAGMVVGLWVFQPVGFLIGFLLISALHFSGDPAAGTPWAARTLYGGAIIVLPTLLHREEVAGLFGFLVGMDAASFLVPWVRGLAWPWLVGLGLSAIWSGRRDWLTGLELGAVAVLAVFAPPLISFVVFFCGMHSARHILRTFKYAGHSSPGLIGGAALLPMIGVVAASALAWHFLKDQSLDAQIVQLVFVGLAALTVPHMALVEQVRLSGWVQGGRKRG